LRDLGDEEMKTITWACVFMLRILPLVELEMVRIYSY
jgi:hypothetical protein